MMGIMSKDTPPIVFRLFQLCFSLMMCTQTVAVQERKNVLIIIGDDAGFQMGTYNNSVCKTPNMDKLASRSVIFNNAYTSVSSCSPSRSAILTGLPQHQNGNYGLQHTIHHFNSFDKVRSLPVILKKHGIRAGIVGKKHVGPGSVYKFDYDESSDDNNMDQIGRNITYMIEKIRPFLKNPDPRPFLLYVGFFDPHRQGPKNPQYGPFAEKFGNGEPGMGIIPDWTPVHYRPEDVIVPFFIPDTPAARADIAAQYTTMSRIDQGIGLIMAELEKTGHLNDTLVLYTADNGIPWPDAKTNLYDPGMGEPMFLSSPLHKQNWGKTTESYASLLDIVPTVLDWFNVPYPVYSIIAGTPAVNLTGKSLLPVTEQPDRMFSDTVFASHDLHEITMYYPMRVVKSGKFKLIHNLNFKMPFSHAEDLFASPTFADLLNRTAHGQPTEWFKTLPQYYYRDEWELYDTESDHHELENLAYEEAYRSVVADLKRKLTAWLEATEDPWRCFPEGVMLNNLCFSAYNGL